MSGLVAKRELRLDVGEDVDDEPKAATITTKEAIEDLEYFCSSSNVKTVKQSLMLKKKIYKFKSKVSAVLSKISSILEQEELESLFLFVLQSAEDYLSVDGSSDELKMDVCVELLKSYCKDDDKLCKSVILMVQKRVKKITFYRRHRKKLYKVLIFFWKML